MKKIISVSDIFPPLFLNISFCNNKKQGNQEQRNNCGKLRFFFSRHNQIIPKCSDRFYFSSSFFHVLWPAKHGRRTTVNDVKEQAIGKKAQLFRSTDFCNYIKILGKHTRCFSTTLINEVHRCLSSYGLYVQLYIIAEIIMFE